ncbi:glucosaminidase domain-containing protein [uncultured Shewanella sp.]|uniref:glucosaminidase domain-containing protein n=1 Tax=uncultured Shewanella sp. TaxID=173975 RepID=UPI0026118579|nr:glucosaminidase domain-containing protein [uncultured Shewanella sp.]
MQLAQLILSSLLLLRRNVAVGLFLCFFLLSTPLFASQKAVSFWSLDHNETPMPNFAKITDISDKKKAFFGYLKPFVNEENHRIYVERVFLLSMQSRLQKGSQLSHSQISRIQAIAKQYQYQFTSIKAKSFTELLYKVDTIPSDLVLIQAAQESGWGSSRFAREGNNFFGQWCYTKGCGLMPRLASKGHFHEVKRFKSVQDSVIAYMHNLNVNGAYFLFRKIRATQWAKGEKPTAEQLVYGLVNYSQRRQVYIRELLNLLRENKRYLH